MSRFFSFFLVYFQGVLRAVWPPEFQTVFQASLGFQAVREWRPETGTRFDCGSELAIQLQKSPDARPFLADRVREVLAMGIEPEVRAPPYAVRIKIGEALGSFGVQ